MHLFSFLNKFENTHFKDLLASLFTIAWIVEARDPYTGGHLWRVSQYSQLLAEDINLSEKDVSRIALGGFVHDLGKVSIPDLILNKKNTLSDEERNIIKTHSEVGIRIIAGHPLLDLVKASILYHHEMPNGKGYPFSLKGSEIPLDARIVGICDAFDAMTSNRPYRSGMPIDKATNIMKENLGEQFDFSLGQQFIKLANAGKLTHIVNHSDDGIPLQSCLMCGPIIVLRSNQKTGSSVFCPSCTTEYIVKDTHGKKFLEPTSNKGKPSDLEPEADVLLIQRLVKNSAHVLASGFSH